MNNLPIPTELDLPIPGSVPFFTVLLVISFILHIIFVNVMIGGTVVALVTEYLGIKRNDVRYDRLAQSMITVTSVNKSIAVVLGVAPLLLISVLYTRFIYSSTVLIGKAWISVVPLVIIAFLFLYAYKFSWESMRNSKGMHMLLGLGGVIPLLFIPLIFSTNMVLMLVPDRWLSTTSFWQAAMHSSVLPRYFHVLFASFALIGIMIVLMGYWQNLKATTAEEQSYRQWTMQYGIYWALYAILGQLFVGPVLLFLQPSGVRASFLGGSNTWMIIIAVILVCGILTTLYLMGKSLNSKALNTQSMTKTVSETAATVEQGLTSRNNDRKTWGIIIALLCVLLLMGTIRHQVREIHLAPYQNPSFEQNLIKEVSK
ncbi:hypothetical protein BHU72_05445 [Desulfuribacillus stibiiarsenatis]|uniref:Uncharacterized protein n=1 Tax=Desulfuribacillus stibiiarsenatis TaxID=1390249 RepID=A0A1E5L4L1_9FIRM|nr:cytochrome ubiquinol oxidase subunit I [Desulfuribacillus stibiiarsenatis]OEH85055.1 hypothetical protein BHU72_05445 [Desulfuribacillus stibiiarsenatis]